MCRRPESSPDKRSGQTGPTPSLRLSLTLKMLLANHLYSIRELGRCPDHADMRFCCRDKPNPFIKLQSDRSRAERETPGAAGHIDIVDRGRSGLRLAPSAGSDPRFANPSLWHSRAQRHPAREARGPVQFPSILACAQYPMTRRFQLRGIYRRHIKVGSPRFAREANPAIRAKRNLRIWRVVEKAGHIAAQLLQQSALGHLIRRPRP